MDTYKSTHMFAKMAQNHINNIYMQIETLLKTAITKKIGEWDEHTIAGRTRSVVSGNEETFFIDDEPILKIYMPTTEVPIDSKNTIITSEVKYEMMV